MERQPDGKFKPKDSSVGSSDGSPDTGGDLPLDGASVETNDDAANTFDPGTVRRNKGGRPKGSRNTPKRGRPKGSGGSEEKEIPLHTVTPAINVDGWTKILLSVHEIAAALVKTPELKLSDEEARNLAATSANVAQHYGIAPSEKTQAWIALMMALCVIYYPRFYLIGERRKEEKAAKAQARANQGGL